MNHIRTFKEHINEGLIKTVPMRSFVDRLNQMNDDGGFRSLLLDADATSDGHVRLVVGITHNGEYTKEITDKIPAFAEKLSRLINVCGYFVAAMYGQREGDTSDNPYKTVMPKNNAEFLKAMSDLNHSPIETIQINMEPKFEDETKHPDVLYHITEKKHLDKIKEQGLVPRDKSKLTYHPERVYLAERSVIAGIYDKYKEFVKDPVLLVVHAKGLRLYDDINAGHGAYYSTENITPDRIRVMKENPDDFVKKYISKHRDNNLDNLLNNLIAARSVAQRRYQVHESYLASGHAPLYHVTDKGRGAMIMREDALKNKADAAPAHTFPPKWVDKNKPGVFNGISLTRDKNFRLENRPVTFILDSDKLSSKYDIRPFDYFRTGFTKADPRRKTDAEAEEVLWATAVTDLHKYILGIRVDMDYEDEEEGPGEAAFGDNESFFWETLSEYAKKYGIEVTDQNGVALEKIYK